jgi:lambda repressor-like predicted transcriptional regulator
MAKKKRRKYPEMAALKGRIREKGTSYRKLARDIGIGTATLSSKINGFYSMTAAEMEQIATILDIDPGEIARFFMPSYCETQHRGHKKIG